ncbi:SDR family NAD(P)-dependent oxidoreductase, partial [Anaerovibrio slackiae]|uniref:SDR family NAD(P)-dependent oxidoreductase n=1 Tax=Anaerovibrio slackiae TaxID=2652309 RepID=UPI00386D98DA
MSNVKFDFTGENFVVTGASSGMGRQVALELAQSGAKVLVIARREEKLRELQEYFSNNIFVAPLD